MAYSELIKNFEKVRAYPDIPAVYVDTGLEYPELRDFVKTKDNVIWLRPRYPFTQILEKYGYVIWGKASAKGGQKVVEAASEELKELYRQIFIPITENLEGSGGLL